jgi:transcriptional regulator with XRE-family HTH domain
MGAPRDHVGHIIKRVRLARGLTAKGLATKAGLSPAAINHLENGNRKHGRGDTLAKVAEALQVSVGYFHGLEDRASSVEEVLIKHSFKFFAEQFDLNDRDLERLRKVSNLKEAPDSIEGWTRLLWILRYLDEEQPAHRKSV